jgi:hypothetical protein
MGGIVFDCVCVSDAADAIDRQSQFVLHDRYTFFLLSLFYAVIFCRLTNKQTAQRIALDFRYGFGRSMVVLLVGGYYKSRLNWRNEPCQLL